MILLTAVADVSASCASPFPPPTQGSLCYLSPLRTLFRKAAIGALVCCSCMQQLCVVLGSERGLSGGGSRVSGEGGCLHSVSLRLALSGQRARGLSYSYSSLLVH